MENLKVSAKGERAAMGGYLPQFDEFSRLVYRNLVNDNLEWIRVADPEAEKLDDIQFSTHTEIYAYQVKWTISEAVITYVSFKALFPKITSSWKKIKDNNHTKKVIPHLLTNKMISVSDRIKLLNGETISFKNFMDDAWLNLKSNRALDEKWGGISEELKKLSALNDEDYHDFISNFVFVHSYHPKPINVSSVQLFKEQEDLQILSRFIIEKAASKKRVVEYSRQQILDELSWNDRFRGTFNHDLIIDLKTYQPITSTVNNLDRLISTKDAGYIYLEGGPGTGKSTLLTQWAKQSSYRVIKYYAFDFTNPAATTNYHERGSSMSLFFDLVLQIKGKIISNINVLPHKDLDYLRKTFFEQLHALSQDFIKNGLKTILIIDGLDHIPREYKTLQSFIKELPLPQSIPHGVYIVLGSQSFALEDLSVEICSEYKTSECTVKMDALTKIEVYRYIQSNNIMPRLGAKEKLRIYEKSQGHPLYLSYFVEKLRSVGNPADTIESFDKIEGNIDLYYLRLWKPIHKVLELVRLLGLIARINGSVNPKFMAEWGFTNEVLLQLRERAKFLFDVGENWSFFHNSFRQFLLHHTCLDILTETYDPKLDEGYHAELAKFYESSKIEPGWKKNFHFYKAGNYEAFLNYANPDLFNEQVCDFRPLYEIKEEAKLGIEVARKTSDPVILLRYLFALSEIEQKSRNVNAATWTERLIKLGTPEIAKRYLRNENKLLCGESTALIAAVTFARSGDINEGLLLFNIAYPEDVRERSIEIEATHLLEESISLVRQWIYASAFFLDCKEVIRRINNIKYSERKSYRKLSRLEIRLQFLGSLASGYICKNEWHNFDIVLKQYKISQLKQLNAFYYVLIEAIEHCILQREFDVAGNYLSLLLKYYEIGTTSDNARIEIANLIYKCFRDVKAVSAWIKDIPQQSNVGETNLGYDGTLVPFRALILHNKLLHICGIDIKVTKAIPSAQKGSDEELIVEYERMLCLISKLLAEGNLSTFNEPSLIPRITPVVKFFYKKRTHRNVYSNKIFATKEAYYGLLIAAVSSLGQKYLNELGIFLINEYKTNPEFWSITLKRSVLTTLLENGFDRLVIEREIVGFEPKMLAGLDISARIEECEAQSDIFIALQKNNEALGMLQKAWTESLGVAYSKDYQYTSWIDWLIKINILQPEKAPERLSWFLSHLDHVKETTEGGTFSDAIGKLLEATFNFDLQSGYQQMQWMLRNGNVDFSEAFGMFIKGCLKRCSQADQYENILLLYTEIYLLFSQRKDVSLLRSLLDKGVDIDRDNFIEKHISALINAIEINTLEQYRDHLLSVLADFCRIQKINDTWVVARINHYKPGEDIYVGGANELVIEPYKTLSEKDVIDSVIDFDSLKELVMSESSANSYFDWNNVLSEISSKLTLDNIRELGELGTIKRKRSDYYARLSTIALMQGDKVLSRKLADKSLEQSTSSGWIEHYDGGSRLYALRALFNLDNEMAYRKAFDLFCYDVLDSNYPSMYLTDLDKILPVVSRDSSIEDYWPEIEKYLNRLMQNSNPTLGLPIIETNITDINKVLADFLLTLIDSPISYLSETASKVFSSNIINNNQYAIEKVIQMREGSKMTNICMYLHRIKPEVLEKFQPQIQTFANHSNYTVRSNARFLLNELGSPYRSDYSIPVPAAYRLHLPENPEFNMNVFRPLMHLICEEAEIDMAKIEHRVAHFSKLYGMPEKWSQNYEEEVRKNLESTGMKYPYRKQKIVDVRNALLYIVAELEDCKLLDMNEFSQYFVFFDYAVPFYPVVAKPSIIPIIKKEGQISIRTGWVPKIDDSPRLNNEILLYNDQVIIGESYTIKNLDWGSPTEFYIGGLSCFRKTRNVFGSIFHRLSDAYYTLDSPGPEIIVERDHHFLQFNNRSKFIAINPALARILKWIPKQEGLFEWTDIMGNFMVKSVFWSSGNSEMVPRNDSEVGEGWIVVASKEAILQIQDLTESLFYHKKVERFQGNGDEREIKARVKVYEFSIA